MKLLRPRHFILFGLAALSGVVLLHTSQNVQHAEHRVEELEKSIAVQEERIRILKAEWAHLNRPERLEKLARDFLDMVPPATKGMPNALVSEVPEQAPETQPEAAPFEAQDYTRPVSTAPAPQQQEGPRKPAKKPVTRETKKEFSDVLKDLGAQP